MTALKRVMKYCVDTKTLRPNRKWKDRNRNIEIEIDGHADFN